MERILIVNADDFGAGPNINRGIIEAHERGIVRSASLLANGAAFEQAAVYAREHPALDIGAHLNVFRGKPLTVVSYLCDTHGNFLSSLPRFLTRIYRDPERACAEMKREFAAQIAHIRDAGISISHVDTEKHLHVVPTVLESVIAAAQETGIGMIRFPYETNRSKSVRQSAKNSLASLFKPKGMYLLRSSRLKYPQHFIGPSLSGRYSIKTLIAYINGLPKGITELSCHPGYAGDGFGSYIDSTREAELHVLCDSQVRTAIETCDVRIMTFRELGGSPY